MFTLCFLFVFFFPVNSFDQCSMFHSHDVNQTLLSVGPVQCDGVSGLTSCLWAKVNLFSIMKLAHLTGVDHRGNLCCLANLLQRRLTSQDQIKTCQLSEQWAHGTIWTSCSVTVQSLFHSRRNLVSLLFILLSLPLRKTRDNFAIIKLKSLLLFMGKIIHMLLISSHDYKCNIRVRKNLTRLLLSVLLSVLAADSYFQRYYVHHIFIIVCPSDKKVKNTHAIHI